MKAVVVAGARPNFMKVAPIRAALVNREHQAILVHTGQHFDDTMSESFFRDLNIPAPDYHLGVGSGTHAEQTARVMERFDHVVTTERPDWVVVVGDVNSTLAAALVAAKHRPELGCRLAHVEAGLRSGDWSMPEEVNRVVTDQLADLLLTHSPDADLHLRAEGIAPERIVFVGNVMIDSLFATLERSLGEMPWAPHGFSRREYGLVTLHRPSNVDDLDRLNSLLRALGRVAESLPLLWPVHPRTRLRLADLHTPIPAGLQVIEPVGYRDMASLLDGCAVVITDSGGLQEESTALGVPCVTLRKTTERPITLHQGTNRLVAWPPTPESIAAAIDAARAGGRGPGSRTGLPAGWDGQASARVVDALEVARRDHARCMPLRWNTNGLAGSRTTRRTDG